MTKPATDITPDTEQVTVVAVPIELYSAILECLSEQPYKTVGKVLNKMSGLQPQQVEFRKDK